MISWRLASSNRLSPGIRRCLSPREFAEHGTYRQTKSAEVALGENIPGHDFSGRVHIRKWPATLIEHTSPFIHGDSHVRERNARPKRKPIKWRTINRNGPITFWRRDTSGASAVQNLDANLGVSCGRAI